MKNLNEIPRMVENTRTCANDGTVKWQPAKSIWYLTHLVVGTLGGVFYFSWSGLLIFIALTALTICLGHSLGMHRRLIHNSYDCPQWLENLFVYFGVLVGMAGPIGMMYQHDLRDWAQRKTVCHPYLRHGSSFWIDCWWQLNCDLALDNPPKFQVESRVQTNQFYNWLEQTWMLQQIPVAIILFYLGDVSWVIWGVSARVLVSVTGHWLIGYYAHNEGERDWHINGAAVQGHNVKFTGFLTMGESWHNNHHAYPGSAMLGLYKNQSDPGWTVLNCLMNLGLVWNVKLPQDLPHRPNLVMLRDPCSKKGLNRAPSTCQLLHKLY